MKNLKILFADDSDTYYGSVSDELKKNSEFTVTTIRSLENLEHLATQNDVIILDIKFNSEPLAGIEALAKLRKNNKKVKVIMFSSCCEEKDRKIIKTAEEKGANGYISKLDNKALTFLKEILEDIQQETTKSFLNWSSESIRDIFFANNYDIEIQEYQADILKFKAEGYSSKEVADKIVPKHNIRKNYSYLDVDNFLKALACKWNIKNDKAAIVCMAIKKGVISVNNLEFVRN